MYTLARYNAPAGYEKQSTIVLQYYQYNAIYMHLKFQVYYHPDVFRLIAGQPYVIDFKLNVYMYLC